MIRSATPPKDISKHNFSISDRVSPRMKYAKSAVTNGVVLVISDTSTNGKYLMALNRKIKVSTPYTVLKISGDIYFLGISLNRSLLSPMLTIRA